MSQRPTIPNVAVIAVHGVGEHERGAAAQAVTGLLLRLRHNDGTPRYSSFHQHAFRVPTSPVVVGDSPPPVAPSGVFAERSAYMREQLATPAEKAAAAAQKKAPPPPPPEGTDPGTGPSGRRSSWGSGRAYAAEYGLMRAQLEHYESSTDPYETVRLEGQLLTSGPTGRTEPVAEVHVYEMYWADLSRIGANALRVFGEMYQLLFHLAHLGRQAVDHALLEHRKDKGWRAYGSLSTWAVRLLTLVIPIFWLTMLSTVLGFTALALPNNAKPLVVGIFAGLAIAGYVWRRAYRAANAAGAILWPLIPVSGGAVGVLLWAWTKSEIHAEHRDALMLVTWTLVSGLLLYWTYRGYEKVRPGAVRFGMASYGVALLASVNAVAADTQLEMATRIVHLFEIETVATVAVWYLLYLIGTGGAVVGIWNRRRLRRARAAAQGAAAERLQREMDRAERVGWTARATIAMSASSALLITFVLWAAVLSTSRALIPDALAQPYTPFFPRLFGGTMTFDAFFARVIGSTAGAGFPLVLGVMAIVLGVVLLAFLPAVLQELWTPRGSDGFRASGTESSTRPANDADSIKAAWQAARGADDRAQRLGQWLSIGYRLLAGAVVLLFFSVFVLQPVASATHWLWPAFLPGVLAPLEQNALTTIMRLGGALAAGSLSLMLLSRKLESLALGFRPMLDAALDVDNYLREHPRSATPRARIAERYASLLRYVMSWRDARGEPYDAVVIVAHSQGTVISADLLGFLQKEPDRVLQATGGRPLYLFTMGSPLRQLYSACFPHLYRWMATAGAAWGGPTSTPAAAASKSDRPRVNHHVIVTDIAPDARPDPSDLGVKRWVNAYRSGDYVGRALWRSEVKGYPWVYRRAPADAEQRAARVGASAPPGVTFVSEDPSGTRRELCVGTGAHTHYWDDSARAVADELDLLVREAAASGGGVAAPASPSTTLNALGSAYSAG